MSTSKRYQHPAQRSGAMRPAFFDLRIPEHAYLLGLLQTDGNHTSGSRQRGRIQLELAATDAAILHRLVDLVPWYTSVRHRTRNTNFATNYETAIWTLSSLDARRELEALGLPPGPKSASIAPPPAPFSTRDYLRGLIDGDGSIGFTPARTPFVSFVTASEPLARFYESTTAVLTGASRRTNRNTRDGVFNPMHQTDAAALLARTLYQPGDLALARKADAAVRVAAWIRPAGMRRASAPRRWTSEEDALVMEDRPVATVADELGRTYQSLSMRRTRLRVAARS